LIALDYSVNLKYLLGEVLKLELIDRNWSSRVSVRATISERRVMD
jgi:hypothetical protein